MHTHQRPPPPAYAHGASPGLPPLPLPLPCHWLAGDLRMLQQGRGASGRASAGPPRYSETDQSLDAASPLASALPPPALPLPFGAAAALPALQRERADPSGAWAGLEHKVVLVLHSLELTPAAMRDPRVKANLVLMHSLLSEGVGGVSELDTCTQPLPRPAAGAPVLQLDYAVSYNVAVGGGGGPDVGGGGRMVASQQQVCGCMAHTSNLYSCGGQRRAPRSRCWGSASPQVAAAASSTHTVHALLPAPLPTPHAPPARFAPAAPTRPLPPARPLICSRLPSAPTSSPRWPGASRTLRAWRSRC